MKLEEANAIKLAFLSAKDRGRKHVQVLGTDRGLLQKISNKDADDTYCGNIIGNILFLEHFMINR